MRYEINGNEVLKVEQIGRHTVRTGYCLTYKTKINAYDINNVIFQWLKFDVAQGEYIIDNDNTDSFQVDVDGNIVEVPYNETLALTFEAPDTYIIKTINEGVGNDSVEVLING